MTQWYITIAEQAERDLRNIYEYIAYTLLEPETAKKQTARIKQAINGLDTLPLRCAAYESELWHSMGLCKILVDNYCVVFMPDTKSESLAVVRIIYAGRTVDNLFSNFE